MNADIQEVLMCDCDSGNIDVADHSDATDARLDIEKALSCLDPRRRDVVRRRMAGETLQEIGDSLGLTRERVRVLEAKALIKLRSRLSAYGAAS